MTYRPAFPVFILLTFFFGQVFFSMQTKSPTCDEFAHHTASGYSHLVTGDFRMNPAEPPFSRLLSAVPLYFLGLKTPSLDDTENWWKDDLTKADRTPEGSPAFAKAFFYRQSGITQDQIIFWARLPILILAVFFGYFIFVWARELFGIVGGLCALTLYSFCPDVLAHSGLATSDISVAFFFYLTLWRFWKYLKKQSLKNLALTGVMTGLAFLSKFSAVMIFPVLFLIVALSGSWKKVPLGRTAGFLAVCFLTVWAGYFFEVKPLLKNTPDPVKKAAEYKKIGGESLLWFAKEIPVPLSTFSSAFVSMMHTRAQGTDAYLMGKWSKQGWWYYYFIAFGIKNTIPLLLLIVFSLLGIREIPADRLAKCFLILPIAFFFLVTLRDKAQAGIRYFLPVYPLLFVLCGGWAAWAWKRKKALRLAVITLLSWHALSAARIYPDYLAYFNELVGGPDQGWRYLRDSNIDWGQDIKGAAEWAKEEGYPEVRMATIWPGDLREAYGVWWRSALEEELSGDPGPYVYVVGVHVLDGVRWAHQHTPARVIGHSVWIYDFRKK